MRLPRLLGIAALFTLAACASGQRTSATSERRNTNILVGDELHTQPGLSLFDQIRRVRPNWLTPRAATSLTPGEVVVYRDGQRLGGVAHLRDLTVDVVESVQFLSGPEAASRFGLDHQHGAILVTTRRTAD